MKKRSFRFCARACMRAEEGRGGGKGGVKERERRRRDVISYYAKMFRSRDVISYHMSLE